MSPLWDEYDGKEIDISTQFNKWIEQEKNKLNNLKNSIEYEYMRRIRKYEKVDHVHWQWAIVTVLYTTYFDIETKTTYYKRKKIILNNKICYSSWELYDTKTDTYSTTRDGDLDSWTYIRYYKGQSGTNDEIKEKYKKVKGFCD